MRLYVPLARSAVQQLAEGQPCRSDVAFAVTSDVEALAPNADAEEHEHLVTQLAAAACPERIVVGVFTSDVKTDDVPGTPGARKLGGHLPARDLVCLLVGDEGVSVGDDADVELSWYDVSEAGMVRDLLG